MPSRRLVSASVAAVLAGLLAAGCSSRSTSSTAAPTGSSVPLVKGGSPGHASYLVYWDQNEEEDLLSMPSGVQGQLVPPWDPNGQMCVLPDGRFVVGYNPTQPGQRNLGSAKPYKQPPVGVELDEPDGSFSGQTLYVPGPYKLPGQRIGTDTPPNSKGVFNDNQTYTGCVLDRHDDVLANDLGTAQGDYPPPSSGRLVEWFAPSYTTYCIVYGPTSGGVGPHHADGTGGLEQPGMMTLATNGDVLVPNVGTSSVLRLAASSLPKSAGQCPGGVYPRSKLSVSNFVANLQFPSGIVKDPSCDCYAVSTYIGDPAIRWFDGNGQPLAGHGSVPGTTIQQLGSNPDEYNPFGLAFAPDGTLYFIDIHVRCTAQLTGCGPASYGGRLMKVAISNGQPAAPVVVAGGFDFPTSVTVCVPSKSTCPYPRGPLHPPLSGPSENPAPAAGPTSEAPARAGFG